MFDFIIKQAAVSSDDVFHIPADEEPKRPAAPNGEEPEPDEAECGEEAQSEERGPSQAELLAAEAEAARREMEEVSRRILKKAGDEAAQITKAAQEKAEALRTAAQQEGYRDARAEKAQAIAERIERVDRTLAQLAQRQEAFFADYTKQLESLAVSVAEKILADTIEADPTRMAKLVMQAVSSVKTEDWVTVEVSDQLPELVEYLKREYAETLAKRQIEFSPGEMPKDACIIQTTAGITDASIATQLGNLREMIQGETEQ
ncbi:MAG: hypothetical protein HDT27_10555 [Subdoligranulum sp.]|nr:hypothetical protein [Subdoligranulum sp.]MBD5103101.1 hypothetical protein [Subdoligranulum sp.]